MTTAVRCLVIGIPEATFAAASFRPEEAQSIHYASLADLVPLPEGLDLVVAPLFCAEFDALELIEVLGRAGYRGTLRIVGPKLPNRPVVLRELRTHAVRQGISLDLVEDG